MAFIHEPKRTNLLLKMGIRISEKVTGKRMDSVITATS